ncbi:unnamed protein product [Urochloa humidicola]
MAIATESRNNEHPQEECDQQQCGCDAPAGVHEEWQTRPVKHDVSLGCRYIDMGESLYQKCAPEAFHLNPVKWGVGLPCQLSMCTLRY